MSDRNCLGCVHCFWSGSQDTGYCSTCAGHDEAQLQCSLNLWEANKGGGLYAGNIEMGKHEVEEVGKAGLVDRLDTAKTCKKYKPEPWVKP